MEHPTLHARVSHISLLDMINWTSNNTINKCEDLDACLKMNTRTCQTSPRDPGVFYSNHRFLPENQNIYWWQESSSVSTTLSWPPLIDQTSWTADHIFWGNNIFPNLLALYKVKNVPKNPVWHSNEKVYEKHSYIYILVIRQLRKLLWADLLLSICLCLMITLIFHAFIVLHAII